MDGYSDGQFALRCVAVGSDSTLADVVSYYLAFYLQVAAFAQHLKPCLALVQVADGFRQAGAQQRIHHRRIVREISDGDGVCGLVIDVRSVEFITDRTSAQNTEYRAHTYQE